MNDNIKIVLVALTLITNGIVAAFMAKAIRLETIPWYMSYITSFVSATVFAYQLRAKILPLTVMSVFQTFFFHSAWYVTSYFILNNELQGHKIIGLLLAFSGMIIMSL
jgi:hypothetical protein